MIYFILYFDQDIVEHNRAEKSKMMNDIKQQQQKQDKMMNEKDQHIDRSIEVNLIIMFGVSVLIHNSVFMFVSFSCACRLINTVDEMTEVADNRDALDTQVEI